MVGAGEDRSPWISGLLVPDEVLLRRFGYVRAVGGGAYILAVLILLRLLGTEVWPLAIGVPVLVVATTGYFLRSHRLPRTSVVLSLLADALVLGGAIAYVGGSGSGLASLYSITIVSAGILLGPSGAYAFTALSFLLSGLQVLSEELGFTPALLHREDLGERGIIFLVTLALLASIGYLTATYASRLHELIAEAGAQAKAARATGRRRRVFVEQASRDIQAPLRDLDAVAEILEERWPDLDDRERRELASRLRIGVATLDAEVSQLADISSLDAAEESRPEPVLLSSVVEDCLFALRTVLRAHEVASDVPPIKVVGNRRAARRVVLALLENAAEHTPAGTRIRITALKTPLHGVLAITDEGPGIPPEIAATMFDPPEQTAAGSERVGLPLVAELCARMGAQVRHEVPAGGGTRFLVAFQIAPAGIPTGEEPASDRDGS